mmetsp:Transcript_11582/g.35395  ORF Transcript_11582/g.35395 Transcript_11582/m.35395 type:complete len:120 (+) Transcript_11582:53-412(+)
MKMGTRALRRLQNSGKKKGISWHTWEADGRLAAAAPLRVSILPSHGPTYTFVSILLSVGAAALVVASRRNDDHPDALLKVRAWFSRSATDLTQVDGQEVLEALKAKHEQRYNDQRRVRE